MLTGIGELIAASLVVGFALYKSDDTNFQIAVLPVAVCLLVWLVPDGHGTTIGSGIALGTAAYVAVFLFNRARSVPMPDYPARRHPAERHPHPADGDGATRMSGAVLGAIAL